MSRGRSAITPAAAKLARGTPYIGAHLRRAFGIVRRRLLRALMEDGFTDLNQAHLFVFQYPPPDGVRPTDLAERAFMTKQAINYLLVQLEGLGYIERRADPGRRRRLVFLTRRGWQVFETVWGTMQQVEKEWREFLGQKRFDELRGTLQELSSLDSRVAHRAGSTVIDHVRSTDKSPPPAARPRQRKAAVDR